MSIISEFKTFIARGNVIDLAVGVVIGGAFGRIVTSFVNDLLTPMIGVLLGNVDVKEYKFTLKAATADTTAVTLNYGMFLQATIDFLITAAVIFLFIKAYNKLMTKRKEEKQSSPPPPPEDIILLREIRDSLRRQS